MTKKVQITRSTSQMDHSDSPKEDTHSAQGSENRHTQDGVFSVKDQVQGDFRSQKEAAWALTNLTSGGTLEQISFVVQSGAVKPMCDLLVYKDTKLLHALLDGILNILESEDKDLVPESSTGSNQYQFNTNTVNPQGFSF